MLGNDERFVFNLIQPEGSVAFDGAGGAGDAGIFGGGWRGVYKWCLQANVRNSGLFENDPLFLFYDMVILHIDADVAAENPATDKIQPIPALLNHLPCEQPCPPCSDTTNNLRTVMLSWISKSETPPKTVLCTPSKNTEAWVMAICFPNDKEMIRKGFECHPSPQDRLSQQKKVNRFEKTRCDYEFRADQFFEGWKRISSELTEANRFELDFIKVVERIHLIRSSK
jgi:hypothetical protein